MKRHYEALTNLEANGRVYKRGDIVLLDDGHGLPECDPDDPMACKKRVEVGRGQTQAGCEFDGHHLRPRPDLDKAAEQTESGPPKQGPAIGGAA